MHVCDEFCPTGAKHQVEPHEPMRPADYPSIEALRTLQAEWPDEPPYCVVCGHRLMTEGDPSNPFPEDAEAHARQELDAEAA
jgi:hypothetical protein